MLNKAKKLAKRAVGTQAYKVMFSLQIFDLVMPSDHKIKDGTILSVCFERGGKISATKNKPITKASCAYDEKGCHFLWDDKIELVATLYREHKTNAFMKKKGKLILRQLKKNNLFGSEAHQGLGLVNLELEKFANELGYSRTITFKSTIPIEVQDVIFQLNVDICVTLLRSVAENEETMSMASYTSDSSEISTIGAFFDRQGISLSVRRKSRKNVEEDDDDNESVASSRASMDFSDIYSESDSEKVVPYHIEKESPVATLPVAVTGHTAITNTLHQHRQLSGGVKPITTTINKQRSLKSNNNLHEETKTEPPPTVEKTTTESPSEVQTGKISKVSIINGPEGSIKTKNAEKSDAALVDNVDVIAAVNAALNAAMSEQSTFQPPPPPPPPVLPSAGKLSRLLQSPPPPPPKKVTIAQDDAMSLPAVPTAMETVEAVVVEGGEKAPESGVNVEVSMVDGEKVEDIKTVEEKSFEQTEDKRLEELPPPSDKEAAAVEVVEVQSESKVLDEIMSQMVIEVLETAQQGSAQPVMGTEEVEEKLEAEAMHDEDLQNVKESDDLESNQALHSDAAVIEEEPSEAAGMQEAAEAALTEEPSETVVQTDEATVVETVEATEATEGTEDAKQHSGRRKHHRHHHSSKSKRSHRVKKVRTTAEEIHYFKSELSGKSDKIQQLHDELEQLSEVYKTQLLAVRTDLIQTEAMLEAEKRSRQSDATIFATQNEASIDPNQQFVQENLMEALRLSRSETAAVTEELSKCKAEIMFLKEEAAYQKRVADQAKKDRDEEMTASHEAATVAVQAAMRRAELQQETEEVLDQLIEIKMKHANMAIELEVEKKRVFVCKKRMQLYAEKIAAMEIAMCKIDVATDNNLPEIAQPVETNETVEAVEEVEGMQGVEVVGEDKQDEDLEVAEEVKENDEV